MKKRFLTLGLMVLSFMFVNVSILADEYYYTESYELENGDIAAQGYYYDEDTGEAGVNFLYYDPYTGDTYEEIIYGY